MEKDLSSVGKHFIVGLSGVSLSNTERKLLSRLQPLGIILFAKNFAAASDDWRGRLAQLLHEVSESVGGKKLLVSVDHEGGRVHRFPAPVTKFPAARYWGRAAPDVAFAMGQELRALGFNLSYAPVLDIHSEPQNTVIGDRSFGTEPQSVIPRAKETISGLHRAGVLSCCKHFPGHGDTKQDSHLELPYLTVSREQLETRELVPFRELVAFGVPLLMTAHVRYLSIDEKNPASISKAVHDILRNDVGFDKAVITDDLEMKALGDYSPAERALLPIRAGSDILLEANPKHGAALEIAAEMAEALLTASESREIDLHPSSERIDELLLFVEKISASPVCGPEAVGCEQHAKLAASVASSRA